MFKIAKILKFDASIFSSICYFTKEKQLKRENIKYCNAGGKFDLAILNTL